MGGLLADPAMTLPGLFGEKATFGFDWLRSYPYALPGVLNAVFLTCTGLLVFLGLEEVRAPPPPLPNFNLTSVQTLPSRRGTVDYGIQILNRIKTSIGFGTPVAALDY